MNNVIMRKVVVAASYTNLVPGSLAGTFTVSCAPGNAGTVYFRGDTGDDVPWVAGEYHKFKGVDLAGLQIKGAVGDVVTIVGGTW